MLTKPITYDDLDGNSVTETFNFNLTAAEAAELEVSQKGGLSEYARQISETKDLKTLIGLFKELILLTYGKREGNRFVKKDEYTEEFIQTGAYSELFWELSTKAGKAVEFFQGVLPAKFSEEMEKAQKAEAEKVYTDDELLTMTDVEFAKIAGTTAMQMSKRHLQIAMQRRNSAA